ncbi:MAG: peptidase M14 [Ruminococcaceae bacterium]|nr:peptidase M14 [Oscillospiraceae bacterium]
MGIFSKATWEQKTDSNVVKNSAQKLLAEYPFLQSYNIGKSILGKEIPVLILGNGHKKFLYVGAHHGMEWITASLLLRFADEYCELYRSGGRLEKQWIKFLWENFQIHIVPLLNPDGVDYAIHGTDSQNPLYERVLKMNGGNEDFSHWQANARGVDLNHNYNAGFDEYKELERQNDISFGAPTRYSGESPESEPEVSALCNYIRFHLPFGAVLTFHTQGEELYWKSRGKIVPGSEIAIRKLSLESGYPLNEAEGLASFGGLTDWCIASCATPAVTFECGKGQNPLPIKDLFPIYAQLRKTLFFAPTYF